MKGGKQMLKKAQSQIITTVLIILLVLAAIVIVWQVVQGTVGDAAEEIETQAGCIGLNMEITNIDVAGDTVTVRRNTGASDIATVNALVFVAGANVATGVKNLDELDTEIITVPAPGITTGDDVQVAAEFGDVRCGLSTIKIAP